MASPFTLWGTTPSFFGGSGLHWDRSRSGSYIGGIFDPLWIDSSTSATGYGLTGNNTYTFVVASQDKAGDLSSPLTIGSTTMIFPFVIASTPPSSNAAAATMVFSEANGMQQDGAIYWTAGATSTEYNIVFQGLTDNVNAIASGGSALALSGGPVTLATNVATPTSWTFTHNSSSFALAYASGGNLYLQGFNSQGTATTNLNIFTSYSGPYDLASDASGVIHFNTTDTNGGFARVRTQTFDPTSNIFGSITYFVTDLASLSNISVRYSTNNDGSYIIGLLGTTSGGAIVIEEHVYNASGTLQGGGELTLNTTTSSHIDVQNLGVNGEYVIAFNDLNIPGGSTSQTHLELFDASGNQIGSDFVISGLPNYDQIRALGGGLLEIDYRQGSTGNVTALIYDTRTAGTTITGTSGNDYLTGVASSGTVSGSAGNDVIAPGLGTETIDGGGGRDMLEYHAASTNFTLTPNANNTWTIAGSYPNDGATNTYSDTVSNVEFAVFSDKTIALREPTRADFDGNGGSDMLWQNSDGSIVLWTMNGLSITGGGNVLNPGAQWKAVGTGDFNADGNSDILLQNTDGSIVEWMMNGNSVIGGGVLGVNPGSQWRLVGSGDFNGDGYGDMLLQNTNGSIVDWYMNGTGIIGGGQLAINPGSSWKLVCSGNFNGDGTSDMLFQNTDGSIVEWNVNGSNIIGGGAVVNPGTAWKVVNSGDFNGDGKSDLVLQNTNGQIIEWFMDGAGIIGGGVVGANPGTSWHVMGTRDYNGDGLSDLLLQNDNGSVVEWFMNGTNIIGGGQVATNPGSSWKANGN